MNSKVKKKWLKALRSGEYDQGLGQLVSEDGCRFCCLGVLCDITPECGWQFLDGSGMWAAYSEDNGWGWDESFPPPEILEIAGMSMEQANDLAERNDDGLPFSKIAAIIEETF